MSSIFKELFFIFKIVYTHLAGAILNTPRIYRGIMVKKCVLYHIFDLRFYPYLDEIAHLFENKFQNFVSPYFIVNHHLGSPATDLYREVGTSVPWINLAHAGKI